MVRSHGSTLCLVITGLAWSSVASAAPVTITGRAQVDEAHVRAALGPVPADRARVKAWSMPAAERVVAEYRRRGYIHARAWSRVTDDGAVRVDVDEGRMQVVFVGADALRSLLFRVDLFLPNSVYHAPTVKRGLDELRDKYRLRNVYHRVVDSGSLARNGLGTLVAQRQLRVYAIGAETFGWSLGARLNSSWGILPRIGLKTPGLFADDDRFTGRLEIAVPYRRFLFEQDPAFQWVHTALALSYRVPRFLRNRIAPLIDGFTAVSRFVRSDANLLSYYLYRVDGLVSVELTLMRNLTIKAGLGVAYARAFEIDQCPATTTALPAHCDTASTRPLPADRTSRRLLLRLESHLALESQELREDHRDEMTARVDVARAGSDQWLADIRFWARFVKNFGLNDLVIRARGVFLTGAIRFWDEAELSGEYLRVFFDNRYWVHEALQLSTGFRLGIRRWIKVGVFHDVSGFFDRSRDENPISVANAFGPGLHFLIVDLFALDVYYGVGFSPHGFDQSLSVRLQTVF